MFLSASLNTLLILLIIFLVFVRIPFGNKTEVVRHASVLAQLYGPHESIQMYCTVQWNQECMSYDA